MTLLLVLHHFSLRKHILSFFDVLRNTFDQIDIV